MSCNASLGGTSLVLDPYTLDQTPPRKWHQKLHKRLRCSPCFLPRSLEQSASGLGQRAIRPTCKVAHQRHWCQKPQAINAARCPLASTATSVYTTSAKGGMWSTPTVVPILPRESLRGAPTAAQPASVVRANSSTALENSADTRICTASSNSGSGGVQKSDPS